MKTEEVDTPITISASLGDDSSTDNLTAVFVDVDNAKIEHFYPIYATDKDAENTALFYIKTIPKLEIFVRGKVLSEDEFEAVLNKIPVPFKNDSNKGGFYLKDRNFFSVNPPLPDITLKGGYYSFADFIEMLKKIDL